MTTTLTETRPLSMANEFIPAGIPSEDGIPMETPRHRYQMILLMDSLETRWKGRKDFYCGGNMFVHFSIERAMNRDFRGPDFFVVLGVDHDKDRDYWASWDEDGRLPDVIVELLSNSTESTDRTTKKEVYQNSFHTYEYYLYPPNANDVEGFRLNKRYLPIQANERGWLWCEMLNCWFGFWKGTYLNMTGNWLRLYVKDGTLILNASETEAERANAETERANAAEAELARLKLQLTNSPNGHNGSTG